MLNYAGYAPTASLDPLQSSGALVGGTELIAIYDALMVYDMKTGEWTPRAAESLTPNADFTVWTLKIRPEVKYANGDPMKAQDVIDNLKRLMGKGRNGTRALIAFVDLDKSKALDDRTAEFHLLKPWSAFPFLLGDAGGWVVNPTLGAAVDSAGTSVVGSDPKGAGAGPYSVERWAPGESPYLVLKARPDYWGGKPCIETINFLGIPLDTAKIEALETGEIDVAFLRTGSVIADARAKGLAEQTELQSGGQGMMINVKDAGHNPITNDIKFRQAVYNALDANVIRDRGYDGSLIVQEGFVSEKSRFYDPADVAPKRDPEQAKKLVEELKAGGWDGKIRLNSANTVPDVPIVMKSLLESAGMSVELNVADTNTNIADMVAGNFDLNVSGFNLADSSIWRSVSLNFYSTSASNRIGFKSADMDAAIDELLAAPDLAARTAAITKMSKVYVDQLPVVMYGAMEEGIFYKKDRVNDIVQTQQTMFLLDSAKLSG